jgi:hypothetical protein
MTASTQEIICHVLEEARLQKIFHTVGRGIFATFW